MSESDIIERISKHGRSGHQQLIALVRQSELTFRGISFAATILMPALLTVIGGWATPVPIIVWISAVAVQLIFGYLTITGINLRKNLTELESSINYQGLLDDIHKIRLKSEEDTQRIELESYRTEAQITAIDFTMKALRDLFHQSSQSTNIPMPNEISALLTPIIANRELALDYDSSDDMYNFAFYIYDETTNLLRPLWRKKGPGFDQADGGNGREWPPDRGFIGLAFRGEGVWAIPNARLESNPNAHPDPAMQDIDNERYASYLAMSIENRVESKNIGVLVFSSSKPGQFQREAHEAIGNFYRHVLSIYLTQIASPNSPGVHPCHTSV